MKYFSITIFAALIAFSCNRTDDAGSWHSNLQISTSQTYTHDSVQIADFMLSPIKKDALWVFDNHGPAYELDLLDSSWIKLDSKFGAYAYKLKKSSVHPDTFDLNLLWIYSRKLGLLQYEKSTGKSIEFKGLKGITDLVILPDQVVVGTDDGLFLIDKAYHTVKRISKIPESAIRRLEVMDSNTVRINDKYDYNCMHNHIVRNDTVKNALQQSMEAGGFLITSKNGLSSASDYPNHGEYRIYPINNHQLAISDYDTVWIPHQDLNQGILKVTVKNKNIDKIRFKYSLQAYAGANDSARLWFQTDQGLLNYEKATGTAYLFWHNPSAARLEILPKHLIMHDVKTIEVFNKAYVYTQQRNITQYIEEESELQKYCEGLGRTVDGDFIGNYEKYKKIKEKFGGSSNKRVQNTLKGIANHLTSLFCLPEKISDYEALDPYVNDKVSEEEIVASYYIYAARTANRQATFEKSLKYDSILCKRYSSYRDKNFAKEMEMAEKTLARVQELKRAKIGEDQRLWEIANAYYDAFWIVGPVTEGSSYDMSFPFQFLDTLLRKYPESKFADDAAFLKLNYGEGSSHEGGDNSSNLEYISDYKSFLRKYPLTNCRAQSYAAISSLYYEMANDSEQPMKYLHLAQTYIKQAGNIKLDKGNFTWFEELKAQINDAFETASWDFTVQADKTKYRSDEPVLLTFTLKNLDIYERSLEVMASKSIPNFSISISRYPKIRTDKDRPIEQPLEGTLLGHPKMTKIVLQPKQKIVETWDITKIAVANRGKFAVGKYSFKQEGSYLISASQTGTKRYSKSFWITVEQ